MKSPWLRHFLFTEDAAQFAVPEIKLGVFPPPACALLPLKVGDVRANEMVLTGENFSGEDLYRLGMAMIVRLPMRLVR